MASPAKVKKGPKLQLPTNLGPKEQTEHGNELESQFPQLESLSLANGSQDSIDNAKSDSNKKKRSGMALANMNIESILQAGEKSEDQLSSLKKPELEKTSSQSSIIGQSIRKICEEDLETLEELGVGSGGTVFRVRHKQNGTIMAKKIITQFGIVLTKEMQRELSILSAVNCPNIVTFYGAYQHDGEICICMEFMDVGSLEKIAKVSGGKISEPYLGKIALSVAKGLVYIYEKHKIIHRDIKPANILVNSQGSIKLCDFGVSGQLENSSVANTFTGTSAYMSPERIQGGGYSTQGDTWSLGLTLLELAFGRYPFYPAGAQDGPAPVQLTVFELLQHIISDPIPTVPRDTGEFSEDFADFIKDTLIRNPKKRPNPASLLQKPFLVKSEQQDVDMLTWAQSFADPNLDEKQKESWSATKKNKRMSLATNVRGK